MEKIQAKKYLELVFNQDAEKNTLIEAFRNQQIAIYGAGTIGKKVYKQMKELSLNVVCFLDRSAVEGQTLYGIPVYKAESEAISEKDKENLVLAFAISTHIINKKEIITYLMELGYKNVVSNYKLVMPHAINGIGKNLFDNETKEKIFRALDRMADSHSREIYCSNIKAHYKLEYDEAIESQDMIQYFDVKVPFSKGYSCFVDMGAFTGDSLEKLVETQKCDKYIGFEPERNNFEQLSKVADEVKNQINEMYLFPCATSDVNSFMSFAVPGASSGNLSESGENIVQAVKLDDVIKCNPTMIKMDIEGAEISALKGGEKLIKSVKPDLAVCVYHYVSDIWEITLLLHKWVPEYKFYLRAHDSATMETVLYATVE